MKCMCIGVEVNLLRMKSRWKRITLTMWLIIIISTEIITGIGDCTSTLRSEENWFTRLFFSLFKMSLYGCNSVQCIMDAHENGMAYTLKYWRISIIFVWKQLYVCVCVCSKFTSFTCTAQIVYKPTRVPRIRSWAIIFFYLRHYDVIIWRRRMRMSNTHNNTSHYCYLLCIIIKRSAETCIKCIFTRGCCCSCI